MSRAFHRLFAWSAIVAFVGTFGLGAVTIGHFGPDDDSACLQTDSTVGHHATQIEAPIAGHAPTHCPFCHWQRMVGGANTVSSQQPGSPLAPVALAIPLVSRAVGSSAVKERPSRAPPSNRA